MPMYEYRCDACGHTDEEFQKMSSEPLTICPKCLQPQFHRVPCLPHTDLKEFHKPIEMYSIACDSIQEVREFQKKCPDVQISDDPNSDMFGIPVVANRKQKLAAMAAAGFEERN